MVPTAPAPLHHASAFLVLFGALCLAGCEEPRTASDAEVDPETVTRAPAVATEFVGSSRCVTCHAQEAARWSGSHHDRAMEPASEDSIEGDFSGVELVAHDSRWRFEREGERFVVRHERDGRPSERMEVVATFGVTPLQQLLVERPGGRRQALPVAWGTHPNSEEPTRWFSLDPDAPAPEGDPLHWDGLAFRWNTQCAACHSTALRKGFDDESGRYATSFAEEDVACEACHGPGHAHVAWAEGGAASGDPRLAVRFDAWDAAAWQRPEGSAIARRSAARTHDTQMDVCAPCHARRSELVDGPEVGAALLDGYAPRLLAPDLYYDDGGIREEVYVWGSFVQSRMFAAGVRCNDCHDPHSAKLRREGDALCTTCHAPERYAVDVHFGHGGGPARQAACVDCHMPETTYMRVDPRRDHAFAIPRPERSRALGSVDACTSCHPGRSAEDSAASIAAWRGNTAPAPHWSDALMRAGSARRDPERWLDVAASPLATPWVRASAWARFAQESPGEPTSALLDAIGPPAARTPVERLGLVHLLRRRPVHDQVHRLLPLLEDERRAVRVAAAEALSALPPDALRPHERSILARGLREYRAVQEANAERPEAQVNLGTLAARFGDAAGARAGFEKAIARAPYFVPAHVNLADLARAEGNEAEALGHLRRALELDPMNAWARYALGLALHRSGDAEGALAALARAVADAPASPRLVVGHALALAGAGRTGEADGVLERAIERGVDDPTLHHVRVGLLRDAGALSAARAAARDFLRRFPEDPRAQALGRELGAGD